MLVFKLTNPKLICYAYPMNHKIISILLGISLFFNGIFGFQALSNQETQKVTPNELQFLSKRIFSENQNDILINFTPLRDSIKEYVNKQDVEIGVYFEYLPSGTSIGVNDQLEVKIASLVKIPVVMATYKAIEEGQLSWDTTISVDADDLDDSYGNLWKRGAGTTLTVEEAIKLMLIESDNTAVRSLTDYLPELAIERVFDSLDIPTKRIDNFAVISPKSYTSILRSLYLSSYLERNDSNTILKILTETKFTDKLPAGIPTSIPVAHKIGVYDQNSSELPVYSDCGIIYEPNRPYSLCLMVRSSEKETQQHMKLLSKMVYGYITQVSQ